MEHQKNSKRLLLSKKQFEQTAGDGKKPDTSEGKKEKDLLLTFHTDRSLIVFIAVAVNLLKSL